MDTIVPESNLDRLYMLEYYIGSSSRISTEALLVLSFFPKEKNMSVLQIVAQVVGFLILGVGLVWCYSRPRKPQRVAVRYTPRKR